jgi:hypothetical protein
LLAGCQGDETVREQQSIDSMLNNGKLEQAVVVGEKIVINANAEQAKWRVSLGRIDVQNAELAMHGNESQSSVQFTKAGSYEMTVRSAPGGGSPTMIEHTMTVVVQ